MYNELCKLSCINLKWKVLLMQKWLIHEFMRGSKLLQLQGFKYYTNTVKSVLRVHSKEDPKVYFKTDNRLMHVKSIAESSNGAFCYTFDQN